MKKFNFTTNNINTIIHKYNNIIILEDVYVLYFLDVILIIVIIAYKEMNVMVK